MRQNVVRRWALRLILVLFDIVAVNASYFMALVLRFYVNHQFHASGAQYVPLFLKFAPYYTVICIAVFSLFKLYSGMWRYAGYNDVDRIVVANLITWAIQILGTVLFVQRMPITYYAIGACIQFFLICVSRLSYRFLSSQFSRLERNRESASVKVMVIGVGETAKRVIRQLEQSGTPFGKAVCVVDYNDRNTGYYLNGLPVLGGVESIKPAIAKYGIASVVIADHFMPQDVRTQICDICKEAEVEVQDITSYAQGAGSINFYSLLEHISGPLELVLEGNAQQFDNGELAAQAFAEKYHVKTVSAKDDRTVIDLEKDRTVLNNLNEAWVQDYEQETGEKISFF